MLHLDRVRRARRQELYLERLRQTDADVLYRDFVACRAFDARPYVAALDVPAVIIAGSRIAWFRRLPARHCMN